MHVLSSTRAHLGISLGWSLQNQLLLEEIDDLRRKEHDLQQVNEDLRKKASTLHQEHELADTSAMVEPVARAIPSVGQGQITRLSSCEPGGSSQTPTVYPTHPNLQDPQTSQTSLHLGYVSHL
jgi:MADS-box transcription factor